MTDSTNSEVLRHFGDTVRTGVFGSIALTEARYRPGLKTVWHRHDAAVFCLVLEGEYVERFRGRSLECGPQAVVFRPSAILHLDEISARGARCFFVEPAMSWQAESCATFFGSTGPFVKHDPRARWQLLRALDEFRFPDNVTPLAVEALVLLLMTESTRSRARADRPVRAAWLRRTRDLLDERFAERLTLDELAREAGVHPAHLAASFRRTFGTPIGEYVRSRRIEAAQKALASSRNTIAEIALAVGFADQSHLTRVFRRMTGRTPGTYRRHYLPGFRPFHGP